MTKRRIAIATAALALAAQAPGFAQEPEHVSTSHATGPRVVARIGRALHVTGPLRVAVVRAIVLRHVNEIQYCYERGVRENPEIARAGTVVVRLAIPRTGAVEASQLVSSTLASQGIEQCIVGAAHRWTFPTLDALVIVEVPFELTRHGHYRPTHLDTRGDP